MWGLHGRVMPEVHNSDGLPPLNSVVKLVLLQQRRDTMTMLMIITMLLAVMTIVMAVVMMMMMVLLKPRGSQASARGWCPLLLGPGVAWLLAGLLLGWLRFARPWLTLVTPLCVCSHG